MPTAYVLINYDIGTEEKFLDKLKKMPEVMEVNEVILVDIIYLIL